MPLCEHDSTQPDWKRGTSAYRQAIIARAEEIHNLKNGGCAAEALDVEHGAIQQILQSLCEAALCGANRAECIEILNTAVDFCATHFADEESFMRKHSDSHLNAHVAAHKRLLSKMVRARRGANGEGLPLATLDAADLLHDFHEHVATFDRAASAVVDPQS